MHNIILLDAPEYPSWPVVGERLASYLSARWIPRSCITEAIAIPGVGVVGPGVGVVGPGVGVVGLGPGGKEVGYFT